MITTWLKNLGITPLGWMAIGAITIYLLAHGSDAFFYDPMPSIATWINSLR